MLESTIDDGSFLLSPDQLESTVSAVSTMDTDAVAEVPWNQEDEEEQSAALLLLAEAAA